MLTSTFVLVIALAGFVLFDWGNLRHRMTQDLSTLAQIIGDNSTAALVFKDPAAAEETLAALKAHKNILSAIIYTTDGRVFAKYTRGDVGEELSLSEPPVEEGGYHLGERQLSLVHPIRFDGQIIGTVRLRSDLEIIYARIRWYAQVVLILILVSFPLVFLLSSKLQRVISEPILHLAKTAKIVSNKKDYSARARKYGQDELGSLVEAFNEMLSQIQEQDDALQEARDTLEKQVEERTRSLQEEIAERKRAQVQAQHHLLRIQALRDIEQAITSTLNLQTILNILLQKIELILPYSAATVRLMNKETGILEPVVCRNLDENEWRKEKWRGGAWSG
jgi:methyl-accepting chemotaxis protein